jgi:hypothetical protein
MRRPAPDQITPNKLSCKPAASGQPQIDRAMFRQPTIDGHHWPYSAGIMASNRIAFFL